MPPRKTKPATPKLSTPINAHKHADKRANIPSEELRDFITGEAKALKTLSYPCNLSVNNRGGFGRWKFLETVDPWGAKNTIRAFVQGNNVDGFAPMFQKRLDKK